MHVATMKSWQRRKATESLRHSRWTLKVARACALRFSALARLLAMTPAPFSKTETSSRQKLPAIGHHDCLVYFQLFLDAACLTILEFLWQS